MTYPADFLAVPELLHQFPPILQRALLAWTDMANGEGGVGFPQSDIHIF
jgi:hypothetical protein